MKIQAAVIEKKDGPFIFKNVEIDEPEENEVIVKIVATGVCQTDTHIRKQAYKTPLPIILGHEGAGIVLKKGKKVTTVEAGDHVIMSYPSCGYCHACLSGTPSYCDHGFSLSFGGQRLDGSNAYHTKVHGHFFGQSSFATHSIVNERNIVNIDKTLPLKLLGPLGCGLQTGAGTVVNTLRVTPGASIAIFGTGGVGLAAIMAAKFAGASIIIAVDINAERLALAQELGATHIINSAHQNIKNKIYDITKTGARFVVECTAIPEMCAIALASISMRGKVAMIGGAPTGAVTQLDMNSLLNGRTVTGAIQGDAIPQVFIPSLIELYKAGNFPFDKLIKFYEFNQIEAAFADAQSGKVIKPVLIIDDITGDNYV